MGHLQLFSFKTCIYLNEDRTALAGTNTLFLYWMVNEHEQPGAANLTHKGSKRSNNTA